MKVLLAQKGQTIVEAIVVIGVVVLLVTGLVAGTTTSLRSASAGRARSQALKFAEEALEYVRSIRDQKWDTFQSYNGVYCLGSDLLALTPSAGGTCVPNITTTGSTFTRSVEFTWDGTKMTVLVTVSYPEGSQAKNVTLTTYYTQWK